MFITLYEIGGVLFRLLGTNGFYVKAKTERFTTASFRCRQNLKYENFTWSFSRLRQNIAPKSVPHVQHDYFSSFNQSNHWFVALSLTLLLSNLKLPNREFKRTRGRDDGSENVIRKCNFAFLQSFLNHSCKSIMLAQLVLTIQELHCNQRFRDKKIKLNICHPYAEVVHTTAKQVISCRGKNENVCEM